MVFFSNSFVILTVAAWLLLMSPVLTRPVADQQQYMFISKQDGYKQPVIVGGKPVSPPFKYGQWLVAIMRGDYQFCAGSVYAPGLMVTAGHCSILGIPLDQLRVMAHRHDLSRSDRLERGILLPVRNITVHPDFKLRTLENDIAVWELDNTDQLGEHVQLDDGSESQIGRSASVMGWGSTSEGGQSSDVLREVALPITESNICSRILETPILDSMLCAGGIPGQDACQGDSGVSLSTIIQSYLTRIIDS